MNARLAQTGGLEVPHLAPVLEVLEQRVQLVVWVALQVPAKK